MQIVDGKPAEVALRDSEARAQAILVTTVDAVVVIDERGAKHHLVPPRSGRKIK